MSGLPNDLKDRAKGWIGRWAKRYLLYTGLTWTVATAVWVPYYVIIVRFTLPQLDIYLLTSFPFCLLAYLVLAPFGRWVWGSIWRIEHHVNPWWKADDAAAQKVRKEKEHAVYQS